VYDNIAFGVRMHRLQRSEVDARVRRVASMLGLENVLHRKPAAISGGQSQRVALGRAIVREPRAFLMDEPLSSIDERLRLELRGELKQVQGAMAATMIYVTHEQSEAMTLGQRVGVMRDGVLQQADTPPALYERPDNLYVAGFVGSPPMNIAEGTIERDADGTLVVAVGGHRLRIDGETLAAHAAISGYEQRQVVLGVRPHQLREADDGVPADARMRVPIAGADQIGGDVYARFAMGAPLLLSADARDVGDAGPALAWPAERVNLWTMRADRAVTIGEVVEVAVTPGRLHLFDPRTGASIEG
jgi:multiple sugar transport system ATP-binding protein